MQQFAHMGRKDFLVFMAKAFTVATLVKWGFVTETEAVALEDELAAHPEAGEHLVHHPIALAALDGFGVLAFTDAMAAIARQDDSLVQKFSASVGLPTYNTGELEESNGHHQLKFPLENIHLAAVLNIIRASAFGPEIRHHTIHEFEITLVGVALLMGLTSVARGIITTGHVLELTEEHKEDHRKDPEALLGDSIFQLTLLSAATQLPLSSFGNAAVGNREFKTVRSSLKQIYLRFLPPEKLDFEARVAHVRQTLADCKNPIVRKRVQQLTYEDNASFESALQKAATEHTLDLMTILMATSCDDSQAAAGDPGPLVGLWQMFGIDFLHAVPALIPYTILIGFERGLFAAQRAGIEQTVFTAERWKYMKRFLYETWRNLILYFVTVAPKISSKIAGTKQSNQRIHTGHSVGVDFSLAEQVLRDLEFSIGAIIDAIIGSFNGKSLDIKKTREAVAELQRANKEWQAEVGQLVSRRIFPAQQEQGTVDKTEVINIQHQLLGRKSDDEELRNFQIKLAVLAATADDKAIDEFAATLKEVRELHGPHFQAALHASIQAHGESPTILAVSKVLQKNPKFRDLLDINYWHDRIGPALTDTLFVVFLQGLHLPFLINTSERVMYNADWFKQLPLTAQEILSILFNNFLGMFADNWADCVVHSKWMTTIYFNQLDAHLVSVASSYPEMQQRLQEGYFKDSITQLIPQRFISRTEQAVALFEYAKTKYPEASDTLETALQEHLQDTEKYYFKAMLIAMTIAVVGAGKSLPGDSTHFTFAANEKDFTLAVTLNDFKRHPVYHVWEVIFSGAYAALVAPAIAQHLVAPQFSKLKLGFGVQTKIQDMMKTQFRTAFPGFEAKLAELQQKEAQSQSKRQTKAQKKKPFG